MILRNGRYPRGKDLGPAPLWQPDLRAIGGGMGYHHGESFREIEDRLKRYRLLLRQARVERRAAREAERGEPALLHVKCYGCSNVFETYDVRRIWCSTACGNKYRRKARRASQPRSIQTTRGQCSVCGKAYERTSNRQRYCSKECKAEAARRNANPASCHPDRPVVAKGLCGSCYNRAWAAQRAA